MGTGTLALNVFFRLREIFLFILYYGTGVPVVFKLCKFENLKVFEIKGTGAVRFRPGSHIMRKLKISLYLY